MSRGWRGGQTTLTCTKRSRVVGSGEQSAWREGIGPSTKGLERQTVESDNWDQLQVLEQYPDEVGNRNKGGNLTQREVISTNVIGHTEQFLKTFSKVGFQSSQQRSLPHFLFRHCPNVWGKLSAAF